jgi:mannitol operon transcriptional antiterminator
VKHTQTTATRIFSDELLVEVLRTDYPNEFDVLNQVVADLLPKHHFQASLAELFVLFISRLEQLLQQIELKALVVCIGGMGSSRMITTRLKNQFPRLILENISLSDTTRYDPAAFDFIISTVQSSLHPERTIKVSPLLFESDILKIKQMIRNIGLYRPHPVLNESKQDYSTIFMIRHSKAQSYEALIQESIQEHFDQGIVTNLDEVVLKIVLNAEIGFGIPETKIAIYHARAMSIKQQSVEIIYTSAIVVPSMLEGELQATTHIIMLSTEQMTENEKQLFNTISVMLTRDSEFISILQTQDINSIQQYINHNMIGEE